MPLPHPRWRTFVTAIHHSTTYYGVVMLGLIWLSIGFHLRHDHTTAEAAARDDALGIARSVEAFTQHSIQEIDNMLVFLRGAYERAPTTFELEDYLRDGKLAGDLTVELSWIGATGLELSGRGAGLSARVDASNSPHFLFHRSQTADTLFIGKPVFGEGSDRPAIQLSRRLRGPDGSFAGVISASLDPLKLAAFYDSIDVGAHDVIALVGSDGVVRALAGRGAEHAGLGNEMTDFLQQTLPAVTGTYVDGTGAHERIVAWRHVSGYPLFVKVSVPVVEALAPIAAKTKRFKVAAGVFSMFTLIVIAYGARRNLRLMKAELALRDSEAKASQKSRELATTLQHMSQGILMVDADQKVAVMNRRAAQLLDLPESFVDSRPAFADLLRYQWDKGEFGPNGQKLDPQVRGYIQAGGLSTEMMVYERSRPDGTVLEVRNSPLPDGGIVRTYTDITERTNAAAALAAARDAAEAAGRARSAFLAMMSHEIRTPLNGVIGMADLLLETSLNEEQRRYAGTLRNSADHLLQIINDVLDFSKLEADRVELHDVSFDLEETIDSVLDIVAPRAFEKGLFIGATVDPALPRQLCGDPAAFRQVLLNLAGNAVKFTARGSVLVTVAPAGNTDEEGRLPIRVGVTDTGIGIPAQAIGSLFREFAQVDGSISRRFGGTGLGLAISRQLVERMGGTIGVTSVEGEGSEFAFTLPMKAAPGQPERTDLSLAGRRVLVMAASAAARQHYASLLSAHGADVTSVEGPEDALAVLRSPTAGPIRTVLVDEASGEKASGALAEAVLTDLSLAGQHMVLATTAAHRLAAGSVHRIAFNRVIGKPASRQELLAALCQMPDRTADPAEPGPQAAAAGEERPAGSLGRILLVEDNATNRLVIGTLVNKLGFTCRATVNGREALEAMAEEAFDLVLMDVMMPEMDGYAATRAIRAMDGPAARTPIVALTANVLTADIKAALEAGMDDFATKPISRDRLEQVIRKTLEKSRAAARPDVAPPAEADVDRALLADLLAEIEPDSARMLIGVFVEDTGARIAQMRAAPDDRTVVVRECHALKSAAATFGLTGLSGRAASLEARATGLARATLLDELDALDAAFRDACRHLPQPAAAPAPRVLSHVA